VTRRRAIAALLAIAALAGCGDRNLVLRVDILSFLDPAATQGSFGPVPAVPGGFTTGEQPLVDDVSINLLDGIGDVATVQSVTFSVSAVFHDSTGSGEDTIRVYLSDTATDPRATVPVLTMPIVLTPGQSDTVAAVLDGDPRVADLFVQRRMRMSVTTSLRGPASGPDLNGRFHMLALDAIVIAARRID
jgi:hypothetical protein